MAKYGLGTLVRVRDSVTDFINSHYVGKHGYLYLVEEVAEAMDEEGPSYWCRSIATGESTLYWEEDEIEGATDNE